MGVFGGARHQWPEPRASERRARRRIDDPARLAPMSTPEDDLDPIALYAIERVAEGETLTAIGQALGMPMGTLFSRCTATSELQRRYWLAKEASAEVLESELIETCRDLSLTNDKAARVKLAGLQWLLSKRCTKRYGDRLALDHASPDGSMSPKEAVDMSKLSDTAVAELMAARKPKEVK